LVELEPVETSNACRQTTARHVKQTIDQDSVPCAQNARANGHRLLQSVAVRRTAVN